jgi:type VI secretion system secreted protein VgrG
MEAGQKITLKVGGSSVEITQSGVTIKGTGMVKAEAPAVTAQASGMLTLKGSVVMIN